MLTRLMIVSVSLIVLLATSLQTHADEPKRLMARLAEWRYPDSKFSGATMSDNATLNSKGERTIPSIQCKAVLTTPDPIAKVFEYYASRLAPDAVTDGARLGDESGTDSGRSVTFHSDSENRSVTVHIIAVNTDKTSTMLVISRTEGESETHIAWTQYEKFPPK